MYYLAMMDCYDEIHKTLGSDYTGKVSVEARMLDNDNEFSYEDQGTLNMDYLLFFLYTTLFVMMCRDRVKDQTEFENLHTPHWYCIAAIGFQLLGIACDLGHHMFYARDGEGILVFDIFSTVLDMFSECTMTCLVLMMANGWFTRYKKFDYDDGMDLYAPMFIIVIMVHVMFGAFTYIDRDAYHKYHDFAGW